jgi:putative hydrolase
VNAPRLDSDAHVHSTFSDGKGTIEENVLAAERAGLTRLTCVDHVRADTAWAPQFVREVRRVAADAPVGLRCGVESKILDTSGALDLPADTGGADFVYAADHQVPLADGPHQPAEVRKAIASGEMEADAVVEAIVESTVNAVRSNRDRNIVVAHLFSLLPKLGLDETVVPAASLERIAVAVAETGAAVEVSERWRCPSARSLEPFARAGARIILSTDSHSPETIGVYAYCVETLARMRPQAVVA